MANAYLKGTIQVPSSLLITAATRTNPMVITVEIGNEETEVNTYIVGMGVILYVPITYGMWQADKRFATITAISGSDFTLDIDSSSFDAFSIPSGTIGAYASISPSGSRNYTYGNLSKQVPFHSYNNRGN